MCDTHCPLRAALWVGGAPGLRGKVLLHQVCGAFSAIMLTTRGCPKPVFLPLACIRKARSYYYHCRILPPRGVQCREHREAHGLHIGQWRCVLMIAIWGQNFRSYVATIRRCASAATLPAHRRSLTRDTLRASARDSSMLSRPRSRSCRYGFLRIPS